MSRDQPSAHPHLVVDAAGVAEVVAACRAAGEMAFDLEFVSEGRMRPELGLVQVAWQTDDGIEVRAVDATVVDPRPVLELACGELPVIAHAARQDLQLLAARFGLRGARLFDTQVAAAFVGMGDQVGYGRLVEVIVGERIDKDVQFTDWLRRPLSPRQLDYALADVQHLPAAAARLRGQLDDNRRAGWVAEECEALCEVSFAAGRAGPEVAWRDVGGARKLRGAEKAALMAVAAWRWKTAEARNRPPTWVLADKVAVEIAQRRPHTVEELAKIRGAGEVARQSGVELIAELAAAADVERDTEPAAGAPQGSPRSQLWEEVFVALVQGAAERTRIPARWIAPRGECEEAAKLLDRGDARIEQIALMRSWRSEVVGQTVMAWVRGEVALVGDTSAPAGLRVVPI